MKRLNELPEASIERGMEARDGCLLLLLFPPAPFLLFAVRLRLPRRLPPPLLLVTTSLSNEALASLGLGVLNMVRFSRNRALCESTNYNSIIFSATGSTH